MTGIFSPIFICDRLERTERRCARVLTEDGEEDGDPHSGGLAERGMDGLARPLHVVVARRRPEADDRR